MASAPAPGYQAMGGAMDMSRPAPAMDPSERVAEAAPMGGGDFGGDGERGPAREMKASTADAPPSPPPAQGAPSSPPDGKAAIASPLLIYRAELTMAVFEKRATLTGAEKLARELGGYLVRRSDDHIVIRVPAAKFEDALKQLGGLGDLKHQNVEVEDVTEQFMDLNVRIKNTRSVLARYEQLLAKAGNVEESLKIERELERVTTQLELLEGRMKVLRELISFSTITLQLQARGTEQAPQVQLPFQWLRELGLPRLLSM
ncbi:MAG: DUF4349 domain-containing protein [Polyangiaceae bacterium]|nr:DUF4349 domain-containing protein [Polyangiaceae bacterium]